MKIHKKLVFALAVALAALVAGSIAWAAIPDPRGLIYGCYDKQSGELRVMDTQTGQPKACGSKEQPLNWNQQGPQGVPGPQGTQGTQGPQGPAGPQGPSGATSAHNAETVGQVTIAGVNGGVAMPIRGFAWEASNSGGGFGGGAGGKTTIDDLTVVRTIDATTPTLVDDTVNGQHVQNAVVDLFVPGTQTAYARYTLTDVTLSKIVHSGSDETLSLHPTQIGEQSLAGVTPPALPAGAQTGTLTLAGFADAMPISGSGFEAAAPDGVPSGTIQPLRVDLALGANSPQLVQRVLTGMHLNAATVQTDNATYHLTDVTIRSVHDEATGAAGSFPTERLTLDAVQVQVTAP